MTTVTYEKIFSNKFVYTRAIIPPEIDRLIWKSNFEDFGIIPGEVRFRIKGVEGDLKEVLKNIFQDLTNDPYLIENISKFHFDINKMTFAEWIPMHGETAQLSPFEVILWLVKDNKFKGRDFVTINPQGEPRIVKPENGLVCFLDTTCPESRHGVTMLNTNTEIISITGGLGKKGGPC